jgi:ATP-dependent DNA ligase
VPSCPILYTSHLDGHGVKLFEAACQYDLEGIVPKLKGSIYGSSDEQSVNWVKVKSPQYGQIRGKHELKRKRAFR